MTGNAQTRDGTPVLLPLASRRQELASGQQPIAIVLSCIDSRVTPELVFHQEPGSIMVTRVIGNTLERAALAAVEFALTQFAVPLVFVLGHSQCAAYGGDAAKITRNVSRVVAALPRRSRVVRAALKENAAGIAGGVYDIASATVTLVP